MFKRLTETFYRCPDNMEREVGTRLGTGTRREFRKHGASPSMTYLGGGQRREESRKRTLRILSGMTV